MRVAELSRRTGVSVASIKYYLREGLLPPGERTSPNQASYGEEHVRRLRLVRALIDVGRLSVVGTRDVLAAIDDDGVSLHQALGRAQEAVMARVEPTAADDAVEHAERTVAELVGRRGWVVSPDNPGRRAAVDVLATLERLGGERVAGLVDVYAEAMEVVAGHEVTAVVDPGDRERSVERVAIGIVLGGALVAALRGMAEESASARLLQAGPAPAGTRASVRVVAAPIDFPSRIGVWWTSDSWAIRDAQQVARDIEAMGYGSLFYGEAYGKETLTQAGAFLAATDRLVVGTGIANIHARDPIAAESGGRTLTALHPGRFVLGLGVSHAPLVERGRGGRYEKPLATMRDYLQRMAAVPEQVEPGAGRPARLVAALGPKMIELAGAETDGVHPYLVLPDQTRVTRDALGPGGWVVSEQAVAVGDDAEDALRRAHQHLEIYSGLPNYRNSWLRQGFDESDLVRGGSERLARALVGMGDLATIAASVTAHLDAGADHVVVQALGDSPATDPRPALEELAAALPM